MNFTTNLPKNNSAVTYIVASAEKCQKNNQPQEDFIYRMHAVVLFDNKQSKNEDLYILCHIRKLSNNKDSEIRSEIVKNEQIK